MAYIFEEPSHTFDEYLLVPGYNGPDCIPANFSLQTPVVRYNKKAGEKCHLMMNIPMTSAVMQAVSDIKPEQTLTELVTAIDKTGHSTVAVTEDRTENEKLVRIITDRNFRIFHFP